tara:strand:+ start:1015 stop:1452 length:438 start_codon:yes stop_codon:yes gene_type:complete
MDERKVLEKILITSMPTIVTDIHGRIIGVNRDWEIMCRFTASESMGRTPQILQGDLTNIESARAFVRQIRSDKSSFATLINYRKDGSIFLNHLHGWSLGDFLIAETYAENALDDEGETVIGQPIVWYCKAGDRSTSSGICDSCIE